MASYEGRHRGLNPDSSQMPAEVTYSYLQEIERLKQELQSKDQELSSIRNSVNIPGPVLSRSPPGPPSDYFAKVSKDQFDRQQFQYKRFEESSGLDLQLHEKEQTRELERRRQETELARRLEDLTKYREEEHKRQVERLQRARAYKGDLDVQARLKQRIDLEEDHFRRKEAPWAPGLGGEGPPSPIKLPPIPSPSSKFQHNATTFYETEHPNLPFNRFTKQRKKFLSFNPITGELRDTAKISYQPSPPRQMNPFLPEKKNQLKVSTEFAPLPAFQHPKFTKANPKVTASFPVTGEAYLKPAILTKDFKEDMNKFFGN